jgi:two-component system, NtrC family, response regulator HydG
MSDEFVTSHRPREQDASTLANAAYKITVISGPNQGLSVTVLPTNPQPTLLGTSEACTLRLEDREVSRRHVKAQVSLGVLELEDLDSRNGTYVNGLAIRFAYLRGGEEIHIGATTLDVARIAASDDARAAVSVAASAFGRMIGKSQRMQRLYPSLEKIAASKVPVVIEGETGTGKEVLAEAIHECGPRANAPFVIFDCTAVAPSLIEAELFGHERGAFTGAVSTRKGVFEMAHGGTLLIDEIGDLELSLQPKLLRVLERSTIRRVGGDESIPVDVRIIAATRRDLDREVQEGRFRDDLFHRLAVARLELPPLRERKEDIAPLVAHFCSLVGSDARHVPHAQIRRWEDANWPGNIRELRNAVSRYVALGEQAPEAVTFAETTHQAANDLIEGILAANLPLAEARRRVVDELEQRYVARVLEVHGGHVGRAAAASGIARRHFQRVRNRAG